MLNYCSIYHSVRLSDLLGFTPMDVFILVEINVINIIMFVGSAALQYKNDTE